MGGVSEGPVVPRPDPFPVIVCVSPEEEEKAYQPLVEELKASGREVLIVRRPLSEHLVGKRSSVLEAIPARLHARQAHWIGVGSCAQETYHTICASKGVASVTFLEPCLTETEPSHPGKAGMPKLLVQRCKKKRRHSPTPGKFVSNMIGPVEIKVVRSGKEEELPQVILEFMGKVEEK